MRNAAPAVAIGILTMVAGAGAAAADPSVRDHDIVLEDYFTQAYIAEIAVAPDGRRVAYVEGRWDADLDRRNMDLWVADTATRAVTRLTFDPAADEHPAWSADGAILYFTSARKRGDEDAPPFDGKRQIWRVPAGGGEPQAVTRIKGGVDAFALARDGGALYYTVSEEGTEKDHWEHLRKEFDDLEYGHGVVEFSRLWRLDLGTWRTRKLVDEQRVIRAFDVSGDERRVAMITTPTNKLITNEGWSEVDVLDTASGSITRLDDRLWREEAPSPYGWIVSPVFSPDGEHLAFRVDFDGYPGEMFVAHFDGGDVVTTRLVRPGEVSVEGAMAWQPGTNDLWFIAEDHARARLYRIAGIDRRGTGPAGTVTPGDVVLEQFAFSADGAALAVVKAGLDHTPDVFVVRGVPADPRAEREPKYERITDVNPQVATWKVPQLEIVRWTSADGTPVEGILELPPDYRPGDGPLPTLVTIHGGPTASSKLAFRFWIYGRTMFAARGWAVLDPNYRGSTGYGDRFLTDLIGNKNDLDVQDILAGVDALVARGIADPDRLAVTGWSNGGYLTNCLITTTDRFKAASSGAGVFDTVMQWSIEDTPGHVINYSGGLPWERDEKMHETSPLYRADRCVTPTVIHVGADDERVPAEHSRAFHRALHHYLHIPCELIVYPGEGHGLRAMSHRRAKLTWDLEWIEYYALGHSDEEEPKQPH